MSASTTWTWELLAIRRQPSVSNFYKTPTAFLIGGKLVFTRKTPPMTDHPTLDEARDALAIVLVDFGHAVQMDNTYGVESTLIVDAVEALVQAIAREEIADDIRAADAVAGEPIVAEWRDGRPVRDGWPDSLAGEVAANAYQIVGCLADHAGLFEHSEVIRALDYLAYAKGRDDVLPWPRKPLALEEGKQEGGDAHQPSSADKSPPAPEATASPGRAFKVGDRVRCTNRDPDHANPCRLVGTVSALAGDNSKVIWDGSTIWQLVANRNIAPIEPVPSPRPQQNDLLAALREARSALLSGHPEIRVNVADRIADLIARCEAGGRS